MGRKTQYCLGVCSAILDLHIANAIQIKILASYFVDIDKLILQFIWRGKIPRIVNTLLKEKKED